MVRGRHSGVSFPDGNDETDTSATSWIVGTALFRLCLSAQAYASDIYPEIDGRMTGRSWKGGKEILFFHAFDQGVSQ
jgi:hypothetical protein